MKAIRMHEFGDASVLRFEDAPEPQPEEGELLIQVEAAGVGFMDVEARKSGSRSSRNTDVYRPIKFPHIPGVEVSGMVIEIGPGVSGWKIGDLVMARVGGEGGYAERVTAPAWQAMPRPGSFTATEAAAFPASYLTAYHALHTTGQLKSDDNVMIHAASGSLGLAAIQIARAEGSRVIAVTSTAAKAQRLSELGVELIVNASEHDFVTAVHSYTNNEGVELVLDSVGNDILLRSLDALCARGRLVIAGYSSGVQPPIPSHLLLEKGLTVAGMNLSHVNRTGAMDRSVERLLEFSAQGLIKPIIDQTLPLREAARAHRILESREHFGKVVLVP